MCCEKEIKQLAGLTFYLFSPTCSINSIKHERSCKILFIFKQIGVKSVSSSSLIKIYPSTQDFGTSHICANASNKGPCWARDLIFGLSLHLGPNSVYGSSKGSGKRAHSPLLLADVISTEILCTDLYALFVLKPALSEHSKIDKTKDGSLMQVESIAECLEHSAILLACIKR